MKTLTLIALLAVAVALLATSAANAQVVTEQEALNAARLWVNLVTEKEGAWGESESAYAADVSAFVRGERLLGYFCRVEPSGYVIVPLRREFGAIKAFSKTNTLDPRSDEGPSAFLKDCLERTLNVVESQLGTVAAAGTYDILAMFESDHRREWEQLESGTLGRDYQEGDVLLTSDWHQREPYNDQCPAMGCTLACGTNENAVVGCVATAGAQILRYWNWPPYGEYGIYSDSYDWPNMPDLFFGCTWTDAQRDAVAELCHEVGVAVGMTYGCRGSWALTVNMEGVYEDEFYCDTYCRVDYREDAPSASAWFNMIQDCLNQNRPIHYKILAHSIVCDGWMLTGSAPPYVEWYHMNYGWPGGADDIWYQLDDLFQAGGGTINDEAMVRRILPETAIGYQLATGTYSPTGILPYYFDQDVTGQGVTFDYYNWVQFRRGTTLTCTGPGWIRFRGYSPLSYESRLYSVGNMDPADPHHNGILIHDGDLVLKPGGSLRIN
jgi:hypothetical protein